MDRYSKLMGLNGHLSGARSSIRPVAGNARYSPPTRSTTSSALKIRHSSFATFSLTSAVLKSKSVRSKSPQTQADNIDLIQVLTNNSAERNCLMRYLAPFAVYLQATLFPSLSTRSYTERPCFGVWSCVWRVMNDVGTGFDVGFRPF